MTSDPPVPEPPDDPPSLIKPGGKVDPQALRRAAEIEESTGEDDGLRRATFTLARDLRKRLDRYLKDRIDFMSRNQLQRLITEGGVPVNGRPAKASTSLRLGDVVEVVIPPPPAKEIQPEAIPLDVLYEDERIIVINKRADIIVVDRDPLQATSNVCYMFINGRPIDVDDNRHTRLYKKYRRRLTAGAAH